MKNVFLIVIVLVIGFVSKAQTPFSTPNLLTGGATKITQNKGAGQFDSGFILVQIFSDTTAANGAAVSQKSGSLIRVGNSIYLRNTTATQWISVSSGSVTNVGVVNNINELESYSSSANTIIVTDSLRGGIFNYYTTGLTADNGIVFSATGKGSGFWKRQYSESNGYNIDWWLTSIDTTVVQSSNMQSAIDYVSNNGGGFIYLKPRVTYLIDTTLTIKRGVSLVAENSFFNVTTAQTQWNLARIKCDTSFSGDAIFFAKNAFGAMIRGIYLDCTNQISGNGITLEGEANLNNRNKRRIYECYIYSAYADGIASTGIIASDKIDDTWVAYSGQYGVSIKSSDFYADRLWAAYSGKSGFYWKAGSGGARLTNCDFWGNDENGILISGQNITFMKVQVDLNKKNGVRIQKETGFSAPKKIKFIGGNSLSNALADTSNNVYNDIQVFDNARDIVIIGWDFGYGTNTYLPRYAISDSSAIPANNTIIGCTFERVAYATDFLDDNVMRYWNFQASEHDAKHMPTQEWNSSNYIINGEFEKFGATLPTGWLLTDGSETISRDTTITRWSRSSLKVVTSTDSANQGVYQIINLPDSFLHDQYVTLVADVYREDTATEVGIEIRENDAEFVQQNALTQIGRWERVYITYLVTQYEGLIVRLYAKKASDNTTTSTAYFDNVKLVQGIQPDAFAINPEENNAGFGLFADGDKTPDVNGYKSWRTQNTTNDTITSFSTGIYQGQFFTLYFKDNNTYVDFNSSTLLGNGGRLWHPLDGDYMTCYWSGSAWSCYTPSVADSSYWAKTTAKLRPKTTTDTVQVYSLKLDVAATGSATDSVLVRSASYSTVKQVANTFGYSLQMGTSAFSPADANNIYIGANQNTVTTTADVNRTYIPRTGTIVYAHVFFFNGSGGGSIGSGETSSIYIITNKTTDNLISSSVVNNATQTAFSNKALSVAVTQGDYIEVKWTTPSWVTNPTNVKATVILYIR